VSRPQIRTKNDYALDEVVSALQKSIRRSKEREALFWAHELYLSGYSEYLFKRLFIICSEDIGLAEPELPAQLWSLYQMHLFLKKKQNGDPGLAVAHAVLLMARSPKSRMVCDAWYVVGKMEKLDIPDHALDQHTARGRAKGRTWKTEQGVNFWLEEGEFLVDEPSRDELPNDWHAESVEVFLAEFLGDHPPSSGEGDEALLLFDTEAFESPKF